MLLDNVNMQAIKSKDQRFCQAIMKSVELACSRHTKVTIVEEAVETTPIKKEIECLIKFEDLTSSGYICKSFIYSYCNNYNNLCANFGSLNNVNVLPFFIHFYLGGVYKLLEPLKVVELGRSTDAFMSWLGDRVGSKIQLLLRPEYGNDLNGLNTRMFATGNMLAIKKGYAKINHGGFVTLSLYGLDGVSEVADDGTFPEDYELMMLDTGCQY